LTARGAPHWKQDWPGNAKPRAHLTIGDRKTQWPCGRRSASRRSSKIPHVGRRRRLATVTAREGEIGFQHLRHFVDVFLHRLDFRRLLFDER
jgi:hypothetical protein